MVIPASNANSRQAELDSVEEWSRTNNLEVNHTKYAEIIFTDKRRKTVEHPPAPMPNIKRVSSMSVTFTSEPSIWFRAYSGYYKFMCINFVCAENLEGA